MYRIAASLPDAPRPNLKVKSDVPAVEVHVVRNLVLTSLSHGEQAQAPSGVSTEKRQSCYYNNISVVSCGRMPLSNHLLQAKQMRKEAKALEKIPSPVVGACTTTVSASAGFEALQRPHLALVGTFIAWHALHLHLEA